MCGIAGFLDASHRFGRFEMEAIARAMADSLRHRGPDDSDVWVDAGAGVALSHRRLSIIDLSAEGRQPMHSVCGRYTVTFNGEIYNYEEIRSELNGRITFRGRSDTEVMLAAFTQWGLDATLPKLNGQYAFAVWDEHERRLAMVRDRMGEKPLYYGWLNKSFLFGSELKALRAHPDFRGDIDRGALALYLRYGYVPGPYSIYKQVSKLPPASVARVDVLKPGDAPEIREYWSLRDAAARGLSDPLDLPENELVEQLDEKLRDAVRSRMHADVPLGAFLSGGIDSSTVVALMQAQSSRPVRTFSIGFCEAGYDEAVHARKVARHIGVEHTELYVTPSEAIDVIPRLPAMYDEPFADSSQIPTYLVSKLAREHVTVSLSGDGGDELFGGYRRYQLGARRWRQMSAIPTAARRALGFGAQRIPPRLVDAAMFWARPALLRRGMKGRPGDFVRRMGENFAYSTRGELYRDMLSHWKSPSSVIRGGVELPTRLDAIDCGLNDFTAEMMFIDSMMYLPDDILVKVDRASMSVSLEARVPLLDHRLVEYAWRIPIALNFERGQGKRLLRKALHRYVPAEMVERPKMGFGLPIAEWLKGPLRDWAESLLDPVQMAEDGFLNPALVRSRWKEHLAGQGDWSYLLWDVLMFQAWHEASSGAPPVSERAVVAFAPASSPSPA